MNFVSILSQADDFEVLRMNQYSSRDNLVTKLHKNHFTQLYKQKSFKYKCFLNFKLCQSLTICLPNTLKMIQKHMHIIYIYITLFQANENLKHTKKQTIINIHT